MNKPWTTLSAGREGVCEKGAMPVVLPTFNNHVGHASYAGAGEGGNLPDQYDAVVSGA